MGLFPGSILLLASLFVCDWEVKQTLQLIRNTEKLRGICKIKFMLGVVHLFMISLFTVTSVIYSNRLCTDLSKGVIPS